MQRMWNRYPLRLNPRIQNGLEIRRQSALTLTRSHSPVAHSRNQSQRGHRHRRMQEPKISMSRFRWKLGKVQIRLSSTPLPPNPQNHHQTRNYAMGGRAASGHHSQADQMMVTMVEARFRRLLLHLRDWRSQHPRQSIRRHYRFHQLQRQLQRR